MPRQANVMETALKIVARSAKTAAEMEEALKKKGFAKTDIRVAMERLRELNYINDAEYAQRKAHSFRLKGNRHIRFRLQEKGIDRQSIDAALSDLEDETGRAVQALEKKRRRFEPEEKDDKLLRYLAGQGFSPNACYQAVRIFRGQN